MSTKRGRRAKEANVKNVAKPNNRKSEILVLTPAILEKLGIDTKDLSQYLETPKSHSKNKNKFGIANGIEELQHSISAIPNEGSKTPIISTNSTESSMLETANLMTKSVFLSPTFVTTPDSINIAENKVINNGNDIYISNEMTKGNDYHELINNNSSESNSQNRDLVDYVVDTNIDIDYLRDNITDKDLETNLFLPNNSVGNTLKQNHGNFGNEISDNDIATNLDLDDDDSFIDEILTATVEDGNITIELTDTNDHPFIEKIIKPGLDVTEQIVNSKFYTNEILRNHIMNKVSDTTNVLNDNSLLKEHNIGEPDGVVPERDIRFNGADNILVNFSTNYCNISESDNALSKHGIEPNKYDSIVGANNNVNDIKNKEVDAIALDEITTLNAPKEKVYDEMNNGQILNPEHDFSLRKLNKHGVEKPGGSSRKKGFVFSENLKTYKNCRKNRTVVNKTIMDTQTKNTVKEYVKRIDLEDEGNVESSLKHEHFCNCYDFGNKYIYKELSSTYTHVHFLKNKSGVCSVEELFNNNNNYETDFEHVKDDKFIQDENNIADFDICWKSLEHEEKPLIKSAGSSNVPQPEETTNQKDIVIDKNNKPLDCGDEEVTNKPENSKRRRIDSNNSVSSDDYPLIKVRNVTNNNQDVEHEKNKSEGRLEKYKNKEEKRHEVDTVVCGVCKENVSYWKEHIMKHHKYIAWKQGEKEIDVHNEDEVWSFLNNYSKSFGGLKCHRCLTVRKYPRAYLQHMRECGTNNTNTEVKIASTSTVEKVKPTIKEIETGQLICGVCNVEVSSAEWLQHIRDKHEYLAWKKGAKPVDFKDESELHQHLYDLCKKYDGLACYKCGLVRKYIKPYLVHVENCTFDKEQEAAGILEYVEDESPEEILMCGACKKEVKSADWFNHIHKEHNYLGWRIGKDELDVANEDSVMMHFQRLQQKIPTFECRACGLKRKKIEAFLKHMRICYASLSTLEMNDSVIENISKKDTVTCALCEETMKGKQWMNHSINYHYNLAWVKGGKPIDLKNPYEVDRYLKVYKSKTNSSKLVCRHCQESRLSNLGFYNHIVVCNKTEEEIEAQKETCETCQMRFLSIHRQQHMRTHEAQSTKKEIKVDVLPIEATNGSSSFGSRKAATKALAVINNYKRLNDDLFSCLTCNFVVDDEEEFKNHDCARVDCSDSSYGSAVTSTDDEDIDEYDDDDEEEVVDDDNRVSGNLHTISSSIPLPFKIHNSYNYIKESFNDICRMNFSQENLYPEWKDSQYEIMDEEQSKSYLPMLNESCQLSLHKSEWGTQNMFEATYNKELYSIFLGGYPTRIAWAPPRSYEIPSEDNEYLAVACHRELPFEVYDELTDGPNLIQIWNFKNFEGEIPTLSICIAHDYGFIWSMAWCPSGTRDFEGDDGNRLGLLAMSCSNGYVYLLSVPNPNKFSAKTICRIKPVAELRLCSSAERKMYQATSIDWSKKSGHTVIIVGYASGVVAYFDIGMKSPILRQEEDGVTIFYPYHDEQMFRGPVLSVGLYAGKTGCGGDVVGSTSLYGASLTTRAGPVPLSRHGDFMSTAGGFMYTHWPEFILTCDDPSASQRLHELEVFGENRRMPTSNCAQCCMHCGEVVSIALPQIRVTRPPHPANSEIKRRALKLDEPSADRFSLSQVKDAAFCLSPQFHTQVAFITQTGMLFVMRLEYNNYS